MTSYKLLMKGGIQEVKRNLCTVYMYSPYINVGEICFIPMNVQVESFNGVCHCVRQLRWQHLSPVHCCCHVTSIMSFVTIIIMYTSEANN